MSDAQLATLRIVLVLIVVAIFAPFVMSFFSHHIVAVCYVPSNGVLVETLCDLPK